MKTRRKKGKEEDERKEKGGGERVIKKTVDPKSLAVPWDGEKGRVGDSAETIAVLTEKKGHVGGAAGEGKWTYNSTTDGKQVNWGRPRGMKFLGKRGVGPKKGGKKGPSRW